MDRYILCDLDGTLAEYHGWPADGGIGAPIPRMVERVKAKLAEGEEVRIFTARVARVEPYGEREYFEVRRQHLLIEAWTLEHIGTALKATATKDFKCVEIWDDRARQVVLNTGAFLDEVQRAARALGAIQQQAMDFLSRGIAPAHLGPVRVSITQTLSEVEQELIVNEFAAQGGTIEFQRRCGGGHAVLLGIGLEEFLKREEDHLMHGAGGSLRAWGDGSQKVGLAPTGLLGDIVKVLRKNNSR